MSAETADGVEAPAQGVTWQEWVTDLARRTRRSMLRHRDGARVSAGANTTGPAVPRMIELTLRTLTAAGFPAADAARAFPTVLHYTIGFVIEEQARTGTAYPGDNPYGSSLAVDPSKFPLTASVAKELYAVDSDANFEYGLRLILTGMSVEVLGS
jgi:TetR/AcrR family tetracycline transcriptional repressor